MNRIYFPGLNGVRFFAALLVILDHTELFRFNAGFDVLWSNAYGSFLGASGVTIFFVLSGFLITYLLLSEKEQGTIRIRNFYVRRVLRIWPLYYLILIIGFFVAPYLELLDFSLYTSDMEHYGDRLILFTGLLANVAFVYFPTVAFANVLWSVAVEEQFYLFWPHVVKYSKNLVGIIMLLIVAYLSLKILAQITFPESRINALIDRTRFSSMMIGGIGAYLAFNQHRVLNFIRHRFVQILTFVIFIALLADLIHSPYLRLFQNEIFSIIACCLIVNIATNKNSLLKLETKWLNYLGKISYGLYVYHLFAVVVTIKFIPLILGSDNANGPVGHTLTLLTILVLTILISHLSYTYFERPFLRKKLSFTSVISGDQVGSNLTTDEHQRR